MSASVTLLVLSLFIAGTAAQVGVRGIYLTKGGERQQYLNLGLGDLHYQLECDIEADPKDVVNVTWSFENWGVVYVWTHATGSVTVNLPLKEHVETPGEGKEVGSDIQFVSPQASMRGVYTCSVYHNREDLHLNPVSSQYELQMYAFFEDGYKIAASVEECTVYWNFSTPRMYPRPTVHCGFWNTSTGVLVKEVRGGLVFHQDPNYLWYVYAYNTPIQVEDIPRDTHFHCTTEVAIANYTRQTDLTDTAASHQVYEKVNDRGCPVLPVLRPHMDVRDDGCLTNCRGECHPFDDQPLVAEYRCDPNYWAYWEEYNYVTYNWRLRLTCDSVRRTWIPEDGVPEEVHIPYCIYNTAIDVSSSWFFHVFALLVVYVHGKSRP